MKKIKFLPPILTCSALALPAVSLVSCGNKVSIAVAEGLNVEASFKDGKASIGKEATIVIKPTNLYRIKGNTCELTIQKKDADPQIISFEFEGSSVGLDYLELNLSAEQMTGDVQISAITTDKAYRISTGSSISSHFQVSQEASFLSEDIDIYVEETPSSLGNYLQIDNPPDIDLDMGVSWVGKITKDYCTWELINPVEGLGATAAHLHISKEVIKTQYDLHTFDTMLVSTLRTSGSGVTELIKRDNNAYTIETNFRIHDGLINYQTKIIPDEGHTLPESATNIEIKYSDSRDVEGKTIDSSTITWGPTGLGDGSYNLEIPVSRLSPSEHLFIRINME